MTSELPFATLLDHGDAIIEVIVKPDFELEEAEAKLLIKQYDQLSLNPKVLVNRSNKYTSSADFMDAMVHHEPFQAIAIYVPSYESALVAESQKFLFSIPFERFLDREEALEWLRKQ